MGLDVMLLKLSKPDLDTNKIYTSEELNGYSHIAIEQNAIESHLPDHAIEVFAQTVQVKEKELDFAKLADYFKAQHPDLADTDVRITITGSTHKKGETMLSLADLKSRRTTRLVCDDNTINSYMTELTRPHYVYDSEVICDQRDLLVDDGYDLLPENCTLSFDKDAVETLVEMGALGEEFIAEWVDGETAFYIWY